MSTFLIKVGFISLQLLSYSRAFLGFKKTVSISVLSEASPSTNKITDLPLIK